VVSLQFVPAGHVTHTMMMMMTLTQWRYVVACCASPQLTDLGQVVGQGRGHGGEERSSESRPVSSSL